MEIRALPIAGAWELTPTVHGDHRGSFTETFKASVFAEVATGFEVSQVNTSVSQRGTVRGIHFADVPPGQAKYVTCVYGQLLDVVVDTRTDSPTFGQWCSVRLDGDRRNSVFLVEGLGHGFCALTDGSVANYLCSTEYRPGHEHQILPTDPALGIDWGVPTDAIIMSEKDAVAPTLAQAHDAGILPRTLAT